MEIAFREITIILLLAAAFGLIGLLLRQPLIVSFLIVGILAGPAGFNLITEHAQIELLALIGISLLLFIVGLKLDIRLIKTVGPVALATGLGQVIFTSLFGFLIARWLGIPVINSIYIAVALTFSSTIIIVKLLSDKKEIDSLHGRIAVGFLIIQDIVVVFVMIGLNALGRSQEFPITLSFLYIFFKGILFLAALGLITKFILPHVLKYLSRSQELLILFAISWAVSLATLGFILGFSKEVGAFLAGVSLASTPFREAISSRLVSLRDFLLLFFFIDLGARLDFSVIGAQLNNAAILSLFVLIGNPLIVMAIMGFMGYRKRTGFLSGLTVAQISEFSLILGALGVSLGHIGPETMGLITLVGLITICVSTYMILYSGKFYQQVAPYMSIFERKEPFREEQAAHLKKIDRVDVILLGLGDYGSNLAHHLLQRNKQVIGVDFNPQVLNTWRQRGVTVLYGDAGDPELYEHLPVKKAKWVVSTVRDRTLSLHLLELLKNRQYSGKIVLSSRTQEEADEFMNAGAHIVFKPFSDAAEFAIDSLTEAMRVLPGKLDWPLALKEIELKSSSVFAGTKLSEMPLRAETGASVLAVTRAGNTYFDPKPNFRIYPKDHLVILGEPESIKRGEDFLTKKLSYEKDFKGENVFDVCEICVNPSSQWAGKTLAELKFRQIHNVTVIGINRSGQRIIMPNAQERIREEDTLILAGTKAAIQEFQNTESSS